MPSDDFMQKCLCRFLYNFSFLTFCRPGCACFSELLQNFSERRILSLCLVVFHTLMLKMPIQTSLPVVPKLRVCVRSGEQCQIFRKTSTPLQDGCNDNSAFVITQINLPAK